MQDILLMLYFKARLLDSLGLLAEPERCAQCDSPLGSTALHSSGEVAFICHRCRTDALRKDRYLAAVLGLSRQQFFAEFARAVNRWLRHMQSELAFDAHDIALEVLDWNRYLDLAMNEYPGKENRFTEEIYRWFLAGL